MLIYANDSNVKVNTLLDSYRYTLGVVSNRGFRVFKQIICCIVYEVESIYNPTSRQWYKFLFSQNLRSIKLSLNSMVT